MIKIAILGVGEPLSGELLRILVNHPEVEIVLIYDPEYAGKRITDIHHGFVGMEMVRVSGDVFENCDVDIFIKVQNFAAMDSFINEAMTKGAKLVDMSNASYMEYDASRDLLGLSELFRKSLVRGATKAIVPRPIETAALISLYPLARNLLLNFQLSLKVTAPKDLINNQFTTKSCKIVQSMLGMAQQSFTHDVRCEVSETNNYRCLRLTTAIPCTLPLEDVMKLYDEVYDDHNFTILTSRVLDYKEVEGTNKCLLALLKESPDTLTINCIIDARLRGGAGEAVHDLNLMFGLHECVGLTFKASVF